jgi:hypothetical protein
MEQLKPVQFLVDHSALKHDSNSAPGSKTFDLCREATVACQIEMEPIMAQTEAIVSVIERGL